MKPEVDDVYDGHGSYLVEVERELRWLTLRNYGQFVLSCLAGWTVAYWVYLLIWPDEPDAVDSVFAGFGVGVLGFIATLTYAQFFGDLAMPGRHRRRLAIASVTAFSLGVVLPMMIRDYTRGVAEARWRETVAAYHQRAEQVRQKWLTDLLAADAHGPAGSEPPMLEIEDSGAQVVVRNISDVSIDCAKIYRRLPDGTSRQMLGRYDCERLGPGDRTTYSLARDFEYAHGQLEFRIGDPQNPEPSWWSDSALEDAYGQDLQVERRDLR